MRAERKPCYTKTLRLVAEAGVCVFISLKELEIKDIEFTVEVPSGGIDYLGPRVRQKGPLKASGKAELSSDLLEEIRVHGHLSVDMEADCDRCLEPAAVAVDGDFDLGYRPARFAAPEGGEIAVDEAESDVAFYEGDGIELNDVLREYVLLSLPMRRLCAEDCKGMCPVCGQNRNLQPCDCHAKPSDDRWAALKQI